VVARSGDERSCGSVKKEASSHTTRQAAALADVKRRVLVGPGALVRGAQGAA
jgi:hypothetical protein